MNCINAMNQSKATISALRRNFFVSTPRTIVMARVNSAAIPITAIGKIIMASMILGLISFNKDN